MKRGPLHLSFIDDDPELRGDVAQYLARHGNDVEQCDNDERALELVE